MLYKYYIGLVTLILNGSFMPSELQTQHKHTISIDTIQYSRVPFFEGYKFCEKSKSTFFVEIIFED